MQSQKPKPLSLVLNKPMLLWVIDSVKNAGIDSICLVKGFKKECIEQFAAQLPFAVETVYQEKQLGTGHAVMQAKEFLLSHPGSVVILNGDAPFMDAQTIRNAYAYHRGNGCSATVISAEVADPTGYGRICRDENGNVKAIVEQKDADPQTLEIREVNSGGFWFETEKLLSVLDKINSNNNAGEYYLPDALNLLLAQKEKVGAYIAQSPDTVLGANDPEQLKELNCIAESKGYTCSI